MKKLSKLELHNAISLSDKQMKEIIGGNGSEGSSCNSYAKEQCSGSCKGDDGNSGSCHWVKKEKKCKCATISAGADNTGEGTIGD